MKTAYEMRISDWSSDVCSSVLFDLPSLPEMPSDAPHDKASFLDKAMRIIDDLAMDRAQLPLNALRAFEAAARHLNFTRAGLELHVRSEEHTSELQSLMRNSYAVFCLKKKKQRNNHIHNDKTK